MYIPVHIHIQVYLFHASIPISEIHALKSMIVDYGCLP